MYEGGLAPAKAETQNIASSEQQGSSALACMTWPNSPCGFIKSLTRLENAAFMVALVRKGGAWGADFDRATLDPVTWDT